MENGGGLDQEIFEIGPVVVPQFLTPQECERLIDCFHEGSQESGRLRPAKRNDIEIPGADRIRNSSVCWLEEAESTRWIYDAVNKLIHEINRKIYHFQIEKLQPIQLTEYRASGEKEGGFYRPHLDITVRGWKSQRKLSLSVPLNDPACYEGGDLLMFGDRNDFMIDRENYERNIRQRRELGAAVIFPSFFVHEVSTVTTGARYSLVAWMEGPNWK